MTSAAWPQRAAFLDALREGFRAIPPRAVYYPGSKEKLARFQKCVRLPPLPFLLAPFAPALLFRRRRQFVLCPHTPAGCCPFTPRAYPDAERIHQGESLPDGCAPFVLNHSLSADAAAAADEHCFREEPWSTVLTEVPLKEEAVPVRPLAPAGRRHLSLEFSLHCDSLSLPTGERPWARCLENINA